jgi:hypothetical protein
LLIGVRDARWATGKPPREVPKSSGSSCVLSGWIERHAGAEELDPALEALGEFAELTSPWTMRHVHVTELIAGAAGSFGLPEADVA